MNHVWVTVFYFLQPFVSNAYRTNNSKKQIQHELSIVHYFKNLQKKRKHIYKFEKKREENNFSVAKNATSLTYNYTNFVNNVKNNNSRVNKLLRNG